MLASSAALFVAVSAARFANTNPGDAVTLMYILPIGILAADLGMRAGLLAAAAALALFGLWASVESADITVVAYLSRGFAFFSLGGLVGHLAERSTLAELRARRWFQMSNDMLCEASLDGHFTHVNDAWRDTLGWSSEELLGKPFLDFVHPEDRAATIAATSDAAVGDLLHFENRYRAKNGSWHWLLWSSRPDSERIYGVAKDITERKELEQLRERELEYSEAIARTDSLTGLPNRRAWDEELRREAARAARLGLPLAVAMLDLDHFKHYNDEHGHQAGDALLEEAAGRWRLATRTTDFVARYGGEEFGVLLPACDPAEASRIVERIRVATPGRQTCSAGVAVWDGCESAEELVARADSALYAAKQGGRARTALAQPGVPADANDL